MWIMINDNEQWLNVDMENNNHCNNKMFNSRSKRSKELIKKIKTRNEQQVFNLSLKCFYYIYE